MKKRKLLAFLLASTLCLSLLACGGGESETGNGGNEAASAEEEAQESEGGTVESEASSDSAEEASTEVSSNPLAGLKTLGDVDAEGESFRILSVNFNAGEFFVTVYQGALFAVEEIRENYGIDVQVDFKAGTGSMADAAEMSAMIEQGVNEGYDAIFLNSTTLSDLRSSIEYAAENDVALFCWWGEYRADEFDIIKAWCVNDVPAQCRKVTEHMINYAKEKGEEPKVVIMTQGNTDMETLLVNETTKVCEELGAEMKNVVVGTDSAAQMENVANAYQSDPSWNLWIAYNGETGVSAANVKTEFGADNMYVAGIDATSTHLDCLQAGTNVCLLEQGCYSAGYILTYQAVDYLLDGSLDTTKHHEITNNEIVTMDNYAEWRAVSDIIVESIGSN